MNVPNFELTGRKLRVRYKGKISEENELNAGAGQGCLLGLWCFLFLCNSAGPKRESKSIGEVITQPLKRRQPLRVMKKKWVDDLTVLISINLKKTLVQNDMQQLILPLNYHDRTGHSLPAISNEMQTEMDKLYDFAQRHFMLINARKTKISLFNSHNSLDFTPVNYKLY